MVPMASCPAHNSHARPPTPRSAAGARIQRSELLPSPGLRRCRWRSLPQFCRRTQRGWPRSWGWSGGTRDRGRALEKSTATYHNLLSHKVTTQLTMNDRAPTTPILSGREDAQDRGHVRLAASDCPWAFVREPRAGDLDLLSAVLHGFGFDRRKSVARLRLGCTGKIKNLAPTRQ
jgi:hypothetical protein